MASSGEDGSRTTSSHATFGRPFNRIEYLHDNRVAVVGPRNDDRAPCF
jgi:hypothetical protein